MRKQVEEQKEELKKKEELLSQQHHTQIKEISSAKETTAKPNDDTSNVATNSDKDDTEENNQEYVNVEDECKEDDQEYVNIDTGSNDAAETKENAKEDGKCDGPEDYSAPYVNMPVDGDVEDEGKEVKNEEEHGKEADEVPVVEFDHVVITKTLSSPSQLSRAKVGTTLKRKPPSRGLIRRTAEESGSQENLFAVDTTAENDYVNLSVNKAVLQQPTQRTEGSDKSESHEKENNKQTDSDTTSKDEEKKVIITCINDGFKFMLSVTGRNTYR